MFLRGEEPSFHRGQEATAIRESCPHFQRRPVPCDPPESALDAALSFGYGHTRRRHIDPTTFILFLLGLVLLVGGAELLVRGASRLALAAGVSPLIVGLTVVAFGTSAPELAVSVRSALSSQSEADIAIGNVVGSNICNVLLILGLAAAIAPLDISTRLVRQDVPIMIGISILLLFLSLDSSVGWWDGLLLFAGIVSFTVSIFYQGRRESLPVDLGEIEASATGPGRMIVNSGQIAVGLAMLVLGSSWLIDGAVSIARNLGVSELVIGLTLVAAGTSLPELATSVLASLRGQRDIAVGNIIGSNIFNILAVLGLTAIVAPEGVRVASSVIYFDLPVMIAVAVACLPIFFTGYSISRFEGLAFLGCYGAYAAYLIMAAQQHDALPVFSKVMLLFVVPLLAMTLAVAVTRQIRVGTQGSA
jgi:cation:H+ antiporter